MFVRFLISIADLPNYYSCHPWIRVFFTSQVPPTSENSCQTTSHHPTCHLFQLSHFLSTIFSYSSMLLYQAFSPHNRVQKQFTHSRLRPFQLLSTLYSFLIPRLPDNLWSTQHQSQFSRLSYLYQSSYSTCDAPHWVPINVMQKYFFNAADHGELSVLLASHQCCCHGK